MPKLLEPARHGASSSSRVHQEVGREDLRTVAFANLHAGHRAHLDNRRLQTGALSIADVGDGADACGHIQFDQRAACGHQFEGGTVPRAPTAIVVPGKVAPGVDLRGPCAEEVAREIGEQALEDGKTARQQDMHMPTLRHALPWLGTFRQPVSLDDSDPFEMIG